MTAKPLPAGIECVLDYAAKTGESPAWSVAEQALYWIDIQQPALHRFDPATGQDRHWMMSDEIGCFALRADGSGALVALRNGLRDLRFADGALDLIAPPPFDPALFRFNEGACDRTGRFWLGTMFDPKQKVKAEPDLRKAEWHSYTEKEGLVPHADFALIPNGLGWDASYETMFISHYDDRVIYAFDFDVNSGHLGQRRLFAKIPDGIGKPDGCAIDEEGCYWCALHGGARLRRFRPDGQFDYDVHLPVSCPTMCAFGGAGLDTLYVTSASLGLSAEQRADEPFAGRLLRFRPGVRGRSLPAFGPANSIARPISPTG